MITYIKINGKKREEALQALRVLSVDLPKVCVMDKAIYSGLKDAYPLERGGFIYEPSQSMMNLDEGLLTLFRGSERVGHLECSQVISGKSDKLGDYDFFFEWIEKPNEAQIKELEKDIEKAIKPFDVKYEIHNK
jgi:hypothetical protein